MPWKNGLGHTLELLKQDLPDQNGYAWRISMADVSEDGAFSDFSGYDRTLLLLEGSGITLDISPDQRIVMDTPLQSAQFDGGADVLARLHNGPVRDFNVMTLQSGYKAKVDSYSKEPTRMKVHGDELLVYAVDDTLEIQFENKNLVTVPRNHLLRVSNPAVQVMQTTGAKFIAVQIRNL